MDIEKKRKEEKEMLSLMEMCIRDRRKRLNLPLLRMKET